MLKLAVTMRIPFVGFAMNRSSFGSSKNIRPILPSTSCALRSIRPTGKRLSVPFTRSRALRRTWVLTVCMPVSVPLTEAMRGGKPLTDPALLTAVKDVHQETVAAILQLDA